MTAYQIEWRAAHPEKSAEYSRKYRLANPEKHAASHRRSWYRLKYGMELDEIEAIIVTQDGMCPICHTALVLGGKSGAHVDHNHETGEIRGILCCNCNPGLGKFMDNPDFLLAAAAYLLK